MAQRLVRLGFAVRATLLVDAGQRAYNASVCHLAGMILGATLGAFRASCEQYMATRGPGLDKSDAEV
jgi:hypothetical protein